MKLRNPIESMVVSIHDFHPSNADGIKMVIDALIDVGVGKGSVTVIPNWREEERLTDNSYAVDCLKELVEQGWEMQLHGLTHHAVPGRYGSLYSRIHGLRGIYQSEFETIGFSEAAEKLRVGAEIMAECGLRYSGFVPPCWQIGQEAQEAVRKDENIEYIELREGVQTSNGVFFGNHTLEFSSSPAPLYYLSKAVTGFLVSCGQASTARIPIHLEDLGGKQPFVHAISLIRELHQAGARFLTTAEYVSESSQ